MTKYEQIYEQSEKVHRSF